MQATLKIDIWTRGRRKLPSDLADAFSEHVEHVSEMVRKGYQSGEIVDERFEGWWTIN